MWFVSWAVLIGSAWLGDLSGTVTVMKKGGKKPLSDHSNAVVFVEKLKSEPAEPFAVSHQMEKHFEPRLLVVTKGQAVRFVNGDPIQHNVFSKESAPPFDLGHYPKGEYREVVFEETGFYKVYCNIHQEMIQDVVVLDNHFFATTGPDGAYRIANLPAGEYQVTAWHIYGGTETKTVVVGGDPVDFRLVSTKHVREATRHLNKEGQEYSDTESY
ncbi:MAG: hypothetical protein KDC35_18945 [Acidobacteria bacterium]|nr:hypothetical protein [Acidobacteriota bacterium]